jgi:hypothetical protein
MTVELRDLVLGAVAALPVAVAAWATAPVLEYFRTQSPDGAFTVVARTQPFWTFVSVMPGQGSDKPARVTLYKGSQSCGSAWADMVSMAREMSFEMGSKPRRLDIKFVADWNLDDCTVIRRWND